MPYFEIVRTERSKNQAPNLSRVGQSLAVFQDYEDGDPLGSQSRAQQGPGARNMDMNHRYNSDLN